MNLGLYRGAAAMAANERRLEAIASNLANVRATGFKRAAAVHHAQRSQKRSPEHTHVRTDLALDWSQGRLERTGAPTDLALLGGGFFAVETPHGERYTRDGHFNVAPDGTLVTQEGFPVAWDGGRGRIDPLGEPLYVDRTGEMHQGQRQVGRVKTIDFAGKSRMRIDGDGYYIAHPGMIQGRAEAEVHQGALEESNVSPVDEMVSMIQTQRSYEAGSTVMQLISQTYRRLNDFR